MAKTKKASDRAMLRVTTETRDTLRVIAQGRGSSMQRIAEEAIEAYRRQMILDETNAAYARLLQDPEAASVLEAEQREWDATLGDGLEDD